MKKIIKVTDLVDNKLSFDLPVYCCLFLNGVYIPSHTEEKKVLSVEFNLDDDRVICYVYLDSKFLCGCYARPGQYFVTDLSDDEKRFDIDLKGRIKK